MANFKTIAEHTIDIDLLVKPLCNVLDAGCRGMGFAKEFKGYHNVYSLDIDELPEESYIRCGLSHINGMCGVSKHSDPQARHMVLGNEVPVYTIESLSKELHISRWDLIKLDIEGAEFEILKQANHPIAKQVSVEFHIHCGQKKEQIDELLDYLSQWYDIPVKVFEARHGLPPNYWDVLLIAK